MFSKFLTSVLHYFNLTTIENLDNAIIKRKNIYNDNLKLRRTVQSLRDKLKSLEDKINNTTSKSNTKSKTQYDTKLKAWSKRVREVGRCDICGSTNKLSAHHLWDKKTHPSLMYQDENGVCLCTDCHNGFHKMYTSASQSSPAIYNKYKIKVINESMIINK